MESCSCTSSGLSSNYPVLSHVPYNTEQRIPPHSRRRSFRAPTSSSPLPSAYWQLTSIGSNGTDRQAPPGYPHASSKRHIARIRPQTADSGIPPLTAHRRPLLAPVARIAHVKPLPPARRSFPHSLLLPRPLHCLIRLILLDIGNSPSRNLSNHLHYLYKYCSYSAHQSWPHWSRRTPKL